MAAKPGNGPLAAMVLHRDAVELFDEAKKLLKSRHGINPTKTEALRIIVREWMVHCSALSPAN